MQRLAWLALSLLPATPLFAGDAIAPEREQNLRNLLTQDCGSCHGLSLQGGLGPALLRQNLAGHTPESLSAIILHGRAGTAMPPWKALLTPNEARWIARQLLEEQTQ